MLNILARKYLWDVGLTYSHGTAHGIGVYLNVHEALWFPLQENMFLSNGKVKEKDISFLEILSSYFIGF